ncbi:MAG: hypothetical protein AB7L66_23055 [Gemmatimonadales bacterium]
MPLPSRCSAVILFVLAVAPFRAEAQAVDRLLVRWDHAFSRLSGVAELPDGRVVAVDNLDGVVFIGTGDGTGVEPLGRTGDGPNEYRRPFSLVRGPADTVLVYAQNRLVRVTPGGEIAGSYPFQAQALGGSVSRPRGVDRARRVYWDRAVVRDPATGAIKRQQQYEIVRFALGSTRVELVATANDHAPEMHSHRFHPFAERDGWVVTPDGTVRIVRARDYSVASVVNGAVVDSTVPIPFEALPVTAADRAAFRRSRATEAGPVVSFNGVAGPPSSSGSPQRIAQMERDYPDETFPRRKPPFLENGVFLSPGGDLWIARTPQGADDSKRRIDIIDGTGRRVRELTLPAGRSLLGLDRRGIYLVEEDPDGLQYLERYAWPAGLR